MVDSVPGRGQVEQDLEQAEADLEQSADPEEQLRLAHLLSSTSTSGWTATRPTTPPSGRSPSSSAWASARATSRAPPPSFSGGWKMRAALAGLLFQDTDVLFLDEPTNHLDVPSVAWLDEYLKECRSSLVLICHDREFLNRHIKRVVSFEPEGLRTYRGNYDAYMELRRPGGGGARGQRAQPGAKGRGAGALRGALPLQGDQGAAGPEPRQADREDQKEIDKPIVRPKRMRFSFPATKRSGKDAHAPGGDLQDASAS